MTRPTDLAAAPAVPTSDRNPLKRRHRRWPALIGLALLATLVPLSTVSAATGASLDQCANGQLSSPDPTPCQTGTEWVNGNLNASKSHYLEGESIPYRLTMTGLVPGAVIHTATIEWDTTKAGKHALDYLTTFNRSVTADPCAGVSGCSASTEFNIPADPQVTGASVTPVAGKFKLFGGTITAVSTYSYADGAGFAGDKSARITVSFTTDVANPVLAWGGHISSRADWGNDMSAVAIPGSPYHMRLIDLDGSGGNQDRSLSADAVIFPASITIVKNAVPDDAQDFAFSATGGLSPATFSLDDDGDGTLSNTRLYSGITNFTTYGVTETAVAGWSLTFGTPPCTVTTANGGAQTTSATGVSIDLKEGENVTCTFVNTRQSATLIVIKHVINDNGGTASASDFTLDSGGAGDTPDNFAGAESPGTSVTLDAGSYNVTESGPSGYTASFSADCAGTIAAGATKTCTVTNDDQAAHLIVIKHVVNDDGGTAVAADFTLDSGGAGDTPDDFAGAESPGTNVTLNAGSYNVTETGPAGYSAGFSADCAGTIANGQTKTCTVTNDDQAGTLIVIKHVINDNGGTASASDFTLDSGGANDTPDNFAGAEAPGTSVSLDAGSYNVTESGPSGYTASFSADCSGSIASGQTKTCTVTNDDQAAHLIVIKHVINDSGGTAVASDFTLDSGGTADTPDDFAGAEAPGTNVTLDAGSYNVTESGPAGYSAAFSADCAGSIANGQTKTCTVTNDDQAATLIVIKHVINDNGGSADASDFTLDSGGANDTPDDFAGAEAPGTSVALDAGSYNVTESGPSGYTASFSADCSGSIANGQTKTCTVTNDDQAGTLIVIKHVINDNGGSADAGDFTLDSGGTNDTPDNFAGEESPGTTVTLDAGTYSVTESGPSGYTASFSADCSGSIANGQTKTCTVTNDDQAGTLIVIKHVVNDNGGAAIAGDFKMSTAGANAAPADGFDGAEAPGTTVTLDAGSYNVTETGPSGYTASYSTDCSGSIGNGQTKTCTVTNDDQAAHLIVIKHVINNSGGTNVAADFTLDSGGTNDTPDDFAGDEAGTNVTLNAGSYSVTESGPAGYARSDSADCSGSIANGQTKTCTVTNDDRPRGTGMITPTATTCEMFRDGTAGDLTELNYGVKTRKINSVSPGVLFYYSKISAPASSFTITVDQSKTDAAFPFIAVHQGQAVLYSASCAKLSPRVQIANNNGTVTFTVTGATSGATYIVGIKYDPTSVVGTNVGNPPYPIVDYGWATSLNPGGAVLGTADGLTLKPR